MGYFAQARSAAGNRQILGVMLCSLLVVFAIATKAAQYHPQQNQVKALTSTKVWESDQTKALISAPSVAPQAPSTNLGALCILVVVVAWLTVWSPTIARWTVDRKLLVAVSWFSPYLAVRPPPSL